MAIPKKFDEKLVVLGIRVPKSEYPNLKRAFYEIRDLVAKGKKVTYSQVKEQ